MIYSSEVGVRGGVVVSGLAATIQDELARQGKTWAWLSRETNIAQSTFTEWKQAADLVPELDKIAMVAVALGMTLRVLIEACGYPVDESAGYADRQARARALIAAVPKLAEVAEDIARLRPDDQDSLLAVITSWVQERERRRQAQKGSA